MNETCFRHGHAMNKDDTTNTCQRCGHVVADEPVKAQPSAPADVVEKMASDALREVKELRKHADHSPGGDLWLWDTIIYFLTAAAQPAPNDVEKNDAYCWFLSLAGSEYQYTQAGRDAYKIVKSTLAYNHDKAQPATDTTGEGVLRNDVSRWDQIQALCHRVATYSKGSMQFADACDALEAALLSKPAPRDNHG